MTSVTIVTGAGSGIGAACAQQLAGSADVLLLADVNAAAIDATAASLGGQGARCEPVVVDVTDGVPSPVVLMTAVKPPPKVPLAGLFVMVGAAGVAWATVKLCGLPEAAAKLTVPAVCPVRVHVPAVA